MIEVSLYPNCEIRNFPKMMNIYIMLNTIFLWYFNLYDEKAD